MDRARIFIDGQVGTTGLRIRDWLVDRDDLELVSIDETQRKDPSARRAAAESADLVVLCLPDDAAREAANWVSPDTRVIDASTAHRVASGWVYGLPELSDEQRASIVTATRVSNPGCWPTAVILVLRPLIEAGLVPADAALNVRGISGYSGGGRSLIERWEQPERALLQLTHDAPYSLDRIHKHMPEMLHWSGLAGAPQFVPAVGPFRTGMRVEIPLHAALFGSSSGPNGRAVWERLHERYADEVFVSMPALREPLEADEHLLDPRACDGTNRIELHVLPHPSGHVLVVGLLDNLGKGAAGAAIQNLNLMLGRPETQGLRT
jgi:N-acetyl-gamma-glutamyl-phosphate reductase